MPGQTNVKTRANHRSSAGPLDEFFRLLRANGLLSTIRRIRSFLLLKLHKNLVDRRHEGRESVATSAVIEIEPDMVVGANAAHAVHYSPTPRKVFKWLMECVPLDIRQCTFVDYGSGRGRVLMAAARLPFRQVIGVEFSRELHDDARKNLATMPRALKRAQGVRSINADAATFEIPQGPCVLYFYNPFTGNVLDAVLKRISNARAERETELYCVFFNMENLAGIEMRYRFERCKLPFWPGLKLKLFAPYTYAVCLVLRQDRYQ